MKIARFNQGSLGVVLDEQHIVDISHIVGLDPQQWPPVAATSLIAGFDSIRPKILAALPTLPRIPLASVRLLTPVPWPNKVIAYPVNYHDHGREL
ncbi:MAG: FAA hydrolase family protein, partial [Pseudomonadota bacterium]